MKTKGFLGVVLLATVGAMLVGLASVQAQSAIDVERQWCINMRASILRNYRAVENIRAARQAGVNTLRAEHQVAATKNLEEWYWKKVTVIFQQMRDLGVQCRAIEIRPDPPPRGRVAPLPRPGTMPNRPNGNNTGTLIYPPYQSPLGGGTYDPRRPSEPDDPFSPNVRR